MSARPLEAGRLHDAVGLSPMQLSDVAEVATIERSIYTAPWTEGNFVDSLTAGYCAWTLRDDAVQTHDRGLPSGPVRHGELIGYFVLMAAVDEAHLLNLSVAGAWQARGLGLLLLGKAAALAAEHRATSIILEVRPSNLRALAVYRRFGFRDHGLRRRYYPVSAGNQQSREDALVMRMAL